MPGPEGPGLPLEHTLQIARQIAEALEAAHEQGVVHRDLKPANIKRRPDGIVKVLDFGLAKLADPPGAAPGAAALNTNSPTLSVAATRAGVILGTAAYMAPEQARGKSVDRRADNWAFGVVLYEMLTGQRLFGGDEISDTLAFVLTPAWPTRSYSPAAVAIAIRKLRRTGIPTCASRWIRGNPVSGQVDAFLNGEEEIEERDIPGLGVGHKGISRPKECGGRIVEPGARPARLGGHNITLDHAGPRLAAAPP